MFIFQHVRTLVSSQRLPSTFLSVSPRSYHVRLQKATARRVIITLTNGYLYISKLISEGSEEVLFELSELNKLLVFLISPLLLYLLSPLFL